MLGISENKKMLFSGWEVRIVKNCDRGLESAAQGRTIWTDPKPVNNLFYYFFTSSQMKTKLTEKTHASVVVVKLTVVRDRKIQTVLRTNQIVGFVTVPAWKKIMLVILI